MREYQQLPAGELPALSHYLAKHLGAHGFGSFDEAPSLARWTRCAQQMFQALASPLAGHLDQPERRETHDMGLSTIASERALERGEHLAAVRLVMHVDEIDDDDPAEIAQAQLPCDRDRGLEVGAENGFLEIAVPDVGAGVHIDGGHRLGLVD